jgi:hypothetical protein
MYAIGVIRETINHPNFDYAVGINDIPYLVKNAEDVVIQDGQPVVVQYEPADQFCAVVPLETVQRALVDFFHVGADDYQKHPYPLIT